MMITYSAAVSEDGFIAREDGDVKWLDDLQIEADDTGLQEFFANVDGLVMGRRTYDFVFDYGSWPYGEKPSWVCTSREIQLLEGANLIATDSIAEVVSDVITQGLGHLWLVGGAALSQLCCDEGLLTNLSLHRMPVKLGAGIPLFARHTLDDLPATSSVRKQLRGFQQIDVVLKR